MSQTVTYLTEQGFTRLKADLDELLEVRRPKLLKRLQEIQGGSDWMDNADSIAIREEIAFVEGRIEELTYMLERSQLLERAPTNGLVTLGSMVLIQEEDGATEQYTIVEAAEADPSKGLISSSSPMGLALLKRHVGDEIAVLTPGGELHLQILSVR
ncbi:MAG: GreA/GreB family elongation factor [Chloroflexi bacterium]|nr:GreA/GreB family elongation factor [Chloroflexota bacterium]MBP8054739.1 GreA/GreB family elongation factor [Chloroflexota bacterium]